MSDFFHVGCQWASTRKASYIYTIVFMFSCCWKDAHEHLHSHYLPAFIAVEKTCRKHVIFNFQANSAFRDPILRPCQSALHFGSQGQTFPVGCQWASAKKTIIARREDKQTKKKKKYIYIYIYIYIYMHTCINVYTYIYIYMYV